MSVEHFDVLIIGAGLSGIGGAHYLQERCPGKTYAVLEARDAIGGTWDLFRYPGIRSDSDMFTLGYSFRPWTDNKALADGPSILRYVRDTAREAGIDQHIRFNHRVVRAAWSSSEARWTVEAERGPGKEIVRFSAGFIYSCSGYYDYANGYTPSFPGTGRFRGRIVHPQKWTPDIDYKGKKVVVIGSGATAVTLVPELAKDAAHVVMLQRTPTYIISLPAVDRIANFLRKVLPSKVAYALSRWKNVMYQLVFYSLSRRRPQFIRKLIRLGLRKELGRDYDIHTHFNPPYKPWDQRMCLVPDADLFKALRAGRASMATDQIETFTEKGIRLKSGKEIEADLVVTATGLNLQVLGGVQATVDGKPVEPPKTMAYKGMMVSGVPNFAFAVGYTNASWTLKCDLTAEYVCRLLNHMDRHGHRVAVPRRNDPTVTELPLIDFSSGYVQRAIDQFPKQGSKLPWKLYQNYARDILALRYGALDDGAMEFSGAAGPATLRASA